MTNGFYSKIHGVTFYDGQKYIPMLKENSRLTLKREPNNQYDSNAIAVYDRAGHKLGHISREIASTMAIEMDRGKLYNVSVAAVTGGDGWNWGANIYIEPVF